MNALEAVLLASLVGSFHLVVLDLRSLWRLLTAMRTALYVIYTYRRRELLHPDGVIDETHDHCAKVVADTLLELGGLWAKIGQFLALRTDLLPPAYPVEFARCQDQLPARPFSAFRASVEKELGKDLYEVFEWVDEKCLSCATIAQVHRARLRKEYCSIYKRDVVIKVQHPGVAHNIRQDLRIINFIRGILVFRFAFNYAFSLVAIYLRGTVAELDFVQEANNMREIRKNLTAANRLRKGFIVSYDRPLREWDIENMVPGETRVKYSFHGLAGMERSEDEDPHEMMFDAVFQQYDEKSEILVCTLLGGNLAQQVHIDNVLLAGDDLYMVVKVPQVEPSVLTSRVLVMSFEEGTVSKRVDSYGSGSEELHAQSAMICRAFSHQMFVDGFMNGDPHPANILFSNKSATILDFGLCWRVEEITRKGWTCFIYGALQANPIMLAYGLRTLGFKPDPRSNLSELDQMKELMNRVMPKDHTKKIQNLEDYDRTQIPVLFDRHGLRSLDLMFVLRITNYIANIMAKYDLHTMIQSYAEFSEKAILDEGWGKYDDNGTLTPVEAHA